MFEKFLKNKRRKIKAVKNDIKKNNDIHKERIKEDINVISGIFNNTYKYMDRIMLIILLISLLLYFYFKIIKN